MKTAIFRASNVTALDFAIKDLWKEGSAKLRTVFSPESVYIVCETYHRILGAPSQQNLANTEVTAVLVYESEINECYVSGELNLDSIKYNYQSRFKSSGSKAKFIYNKEKGCTEACFQNLQVDHDKFERPNSGKQVHEEKYRIVFIAEPNLTPRNSKVIHNNA